MGKEDFSAAHIDVDQLKKYARDLTSLYTSEKEKIKELQAAKQQLEIYADDLATTYESLRNSEKRYRALFEHSPISLWEEDLSQIKKYIDSLHDRGITDFKKYFNDHPEEVSHCASMIEILDVNKATLELYKAHTKEEFTGNIHHILAERAHKVLKEELTDIAQGGYFEVECESRTLTGEKITVLMKSTIPPGYEKTWSKAFISVHDLTERARAEYLKKIFGRYMSQAVMNMLIEQPDSVKLGGEKRKVTIMMSDIRGFTSLSEHLDPERVLEMLNTYFEVMVEIIHKYDGTLNEIIGDSMLVIFGAPQQMLDRNHRAVACAIEMQNAMAEVNRQNCTQGLPWLEMGIGINESVVTVGNIGSKKRSKYGVVGSGVNMTSRIESYTVGGQILISDSVREGAGGILSISRQMEVHPKGSEKPLTVYEINGIGGHYNLSLEGKTYTHVILSQKIPIHYTMLEGNHSCERDFQGVILRLSRTSGVIQLQMAHDLLTNLKFNLSEVADELSHKNFYGKVVEVSDSDHNIYTVRFTSLPLVIDGYFQAVMDQGYKK
jgi:class 3 adenylate cyclase/PAS domain-containing protein